MANINEILARAAALRDETALNSISPERAGGIMYDTLLALNELWLQQGAALVISKIYASVAAMEADTAPVSDLTGKPLRPGQIVVIASSDSDNGSVYRYNGTESPSWSLVGSIGNLDPVDSLDSDSTTLPLAAHQGKVLDDKISQLGQESAGIVIDRGTTYNTKYDSTNRTCVFYPIPDKNATYHIRISEINNQTESYIYLGVLNAQSPYSSAQLFYFGNIQKLSSNDVVLMFQIPENVKSSAEYIGVFQSLSESSLCSFKVELSYCNKDSVCDHTFRMWHKITSLNLNTKVGNVRGDDGVVSTSKFCIFTDLFLLKKGDTIVVGNAHNNIGCIYTNNQQSIAQGDTVTVLVSSGGTDDYQELSYTAQSDIMVGVSFSVNNKFTVYSSLDDTYKLTEIEPIKETIVEEGSSWNS